MTEILAQAFPQQHPALTLTTLTNGQETGRVSLWFPESVRFDNQRIAFLGNYTGNEDAAISHALLAAACTHARAHGCAWAIGPMNGNTWENYRFKTGEAPRYLLEPDNPPHDPLQCRATALELWECFRGEYLL